MSGTRPVFFALILSLMSSLANAQEAAPPSTPSASESPSEPGAAEPAPQAEPNAAPSPPAQPVAKIREGAPLYTPGRGWQRTTSAPSGARARLDEVNARLAEIRKNRPGIAGPIAVMSAGAGVGLISAYLAVLAWAYPGVDEDGTAVGSTFTALAILGVAVGIGGLGWLLSRSKERSVYAPELRELKLKRRELLKELQLGFVSDRERLGLTLGASF